MGTTAQKLQAILGAKGDIKDAIEAKGVTVGDATLAEYASKIGEISGGEDDEGERYVDADVRFIDFDGKCLFHYTKEEFLALESLPTNTVKHEGLTQDGWNWTLAGAKNYVTKYGRCLIGAVYYSTDGSSWVTINIDDDKFLEVPLDFDQSKTNGVLVDWGDGTQERFSVTGNVKRTHTYNSQGEYTIKFIPDSDCTLNIFRSGYMSVFGYWYNSWVMLLLNKIKCFVIGRVSYNDVYLSIVFDNLEYFVIPRGVNKLGPQPSISRKLKTIIYPNDFPNSTVVTLGLKSLREICWPETWTGRVGGMNAQFETILLPKGINTSGNFSSNCYFTRYLVITDSVETIDNFNGCYTLEEIVLPSSVETIAANGFRGCLNLKRLTLNEGIKTIGNNAFNGNRITELNIPSTVTNIGNAVFTKSNNIMHGQLMTVHMKPTSPPTLGTSVFSNTLKIYVPQGSLSAYQTATNWSAYASYMEEEPTT